MPRDASTEAEKPPYVTMEPRLLLGEMPKPLAIVFTAPFCLRKLVAPIPPEPNIKAKSAGMSQGSGSANSEQKKLLVKEKVRVLRFVSVSRHR